MKVEINYPKLKKEVNKFLIFRKIMLIIFRISIITCTIINLSLGGKKWMLYVLGGEIIFYFAILNKPLIGAVKDAICFSSSIIVVLTKVEAAPLKPATIVDGVDTTITTYTTDKEINILHNAAKQKLAKQM